MKLLQRFQIAAAAFGLGSRVVAAEPASTSLASTLSASPPPALARIVRREAASRWLMPGLAAITPQYIEQVMRAAMWGEHGRQWELFDLMLDTWPELAACAQELTDGVSCLKMVFDPFAEEDEKATPDAIERCKLVSRALRRMAPDAAADENDLEGTLSDIVDGWFRGVTTLEIEWQQTGGIIAPRSTFWVHPKNFGFDETGRLGLRLGDRETASTVQRFNTSTIQPFPPHKFLTGIHKAKAGQALGGALLRPLAWWWCAANFSADWLLNLAQIFGLPFRWANYDPTAPQETVDRICAMLQNMGSAGWAAFPTGTTLELKDAGRSGDHAPQGELLDRADRYARLLILGQTQSGGKGSAMGGQAFGTVESDVKATRIEAAGRYACRVLNTQLLPSILMLNYGDAEACPKVRLLKEETGGVERAQTLQILKSIGLDLSKSELRAEFDLNAPSDKEDTLAGGDAGIDPVLQRQESYDQYKRAQTAAEKRDAMKREPGDAEAASTPNGSTQNADAADAVKAKAGEEDGHWVTHEGRHIFLSNNTRSRAYRDWNSGKAHRDNGGNYRLTERDENNKKTSRIAPWNKLIKAAHPSVPEFHAAAKAYAEKPAADGGIEWTEHPGDAIQAPLSSGGHYVISHRTNEFNVSHRPPGEHHHVGKFTTLKEAKDAAETHAAMEALPPEIKQARGETISRARENAREHLGDTERKTAATDDHHPRGKTVHPVKAGDATARLAEICEIGDDALFARELAALAEDIAAKEADGGRWVTIEGRHVKLSKDGHVLEGHLRGGKDQLSEGNPSTSDQKSDTLKTNGNDSRAASDHARDGGQRGSLPQERGETKGHDAGSGAGAGAGVSPAAHRSLSGSVAKAEKSAKGEEHKAGREHLAAARASGALPTTRHDTERHIAEGGEHHVELSEDGARVIKHTKGGLFGYQPDVNGGGNVILRASKASEYLDRTALQNKAFGSDLRVEGSHEHEGGGLTVSQTHFTGEKPSHAEVEAHMGKLGFQKVSGDNIYDRTLEDTTWFSPKTGIIAGDAKPDNFKKTADGQIHALDLMLAHAKPGTPLHQAMMKGVGK